jgi:hypothetical protein
MSCRYRDVKPEQFVKGRASRLKAGCTVESLALAGKPHVGQDGILLPIGNRPLRVFIPFSWAEGPCGQPGLAAPQKSQSRTAGFQPAVV